MIEIQHDAGPQELDDYVQANPNATWDTFWRGNDLKPRIKEHLRRLQAGLCIYCERKPDRNGDHIDHVKPKSQRRDLMFRYENMVCSCSRPKTCGHRKADRFLPIEPGPNCNRYFYLHSDGTLSPCSDDAEVKKKAQETLDILGLNDSGLQRDRKRYLRTVFALAQEIDIKKVQAVVQTLPFRYVLQTLPLFKKG